LVDDVVHRVASQGSVVTAAGDEGDALRVTLLEQGVIDLQDSGHVDAAVVRGSVEELAAAERGARDIHPIVLIDLRVGGDDGGGPQVRLVAQNRGRAWRRAQ